MASKYFLSVCMAKGFYFVRIQLATFVLFFTLWRLVISKDPLPNPTSQRYSPGVFSKLYSFIFKSTICVELIFMYNVRFELSFVLVFVCRGPGLLAPLVGKAVVLHRISFAHLSKTSWAILWNCF